MRLLVAQCGVVSVKLAGGGALCSSPYWRDDLRAAAGDVDAARHAVGRELEVGEAWVESGMELKLKLSAKLPCSRLTGFSGRRSRLPTRLMKGLLLLGHDE